MTTVAIVSDGKLQLSHSSLSALAKVVEKISGVISVTFVKSCGSWTAELELR